MLALEGRNISVKDVADLTRGGQMPTGTAKYEKRAIAPTVPVWIADNCTQVRFLTEILDDFRRFVDEIWRF